jgi:hypothetical protein
MERESMLNGTDWQTTHPQFMPDAQLLLSTCQECLAHLELISDDGDAVDCLLATLTRLSEQAGLAQVDCITGLCHDMRQTLRMAWASQCLSVESLPVLGKCLTLLAWQLELIDLRTGQLPLDDSEQKDLLEELAMTCGSASPHRQFEQCLAIEALR